MPENDDRPPLSPPPQFPKKRFGQHFLIDKNIIKKIVSAADLKGGDHVLEIGPGTGALTEGLLCAGARVLAIEVDRSLAGMLKDKFRADLNFEVITGDALKVSFLKLAEERNCRFKAVSNLPYNISGPVLSKFMEERAAFLGMVLMFQKEVAERIVSGPGSKSYGALSVFSQVYADVRMEFNVPRHLFRPAPKVDSCVVSFRMAESPRVDVTDPGFFKKVVRAAFGTRRKTLQNALKALGMEKDGITDALNRCGIDARRRGETLTIAEFGRLTAALFDLTH